MVLTNDNFLNYAMRAYDNSQCHTLAEFEEDLKKIQLVKKLLCRYIKDGVTKEHLILNHIIVLFNVFGESTVKMLLFKIDKELWPVLIPFFIFLDRMPESISDFGLILSEVEFNQDILTKLKAL